MNTEKIIKMFDPCSQGAEYLRRYKTLRESWYSCPRGDWMLWLAQKLGVDVRVLTLAKGLCVNTVRHLMKDSRSVVAVDAAIAFGRGEIGEKELDAAADAAHTAHADAADTDAAVAAAAHAAAATDAAYAAAADAAYAAAAAAVSVDVRKGVLAKTADICREVLTEAVMRAALEAAERGK